ncbi:hypothetical protein [Streptomyces sp. NRRL F-525]|uniref:hypothetical protein n=1 Tax=Streptomyces sp. NRRL F-525 TaxID=1463861 RepID=UPI00052400F3|nr:hypothetical protein [Streptomyces sp. NRRL F-525]
MNTRTAACAALLIAAATACSSNTSSDDSKAPTTAANPTSGTTATAVAKPKALSIGAGRHWSDTDLDGSHISATTSVISYTQPAKVDLPDALADFPDPTWAILEVKVCADATSTNVIVAQSPWALGYPDDTRIQAPGVSGAGIPKPEYPVEGTAVQPGTCLRGKITFGMAKGTRPDRIIYGPGGRDPVTWTVPKA